MKESKVNYFKGKKRPGPELIIIYFILKAFKSEKFKVAIEEMRAFYREGDYETYQVLKGKLAAITFSGTFSPIRGSEYLQSYSGYIIMDIDHCGVDLERYKRLLSNDRYVHSVWISPSGDGLKFLLKTIRTAGDHKGVYRSAVRYFSDAYGLDIDTSGSDIGRLCYVSYDPELYLNQEAELYNDVLIEESQLKSWLSKKDKNSFGETILHMDKRKIKNNPFDKLRLKKIYHYLKKRKLSITATYDDWVRVAFAISNSFNYDFGYKWFLMLAQLDGELFDQDDSEKLINKCYGTGIGKNTFGTIVYLAQTQGYVS